MKLKLAFLLFLPSLILFTANGSYASEKEIKQSPQLSGELYLPLKDQMKEIDTAIFKAKQNGKLVLIVMGANWCHDSRALASRLFLSELQPTIEAHYQLVFIDVGYFTNVKPVITRFGMPIIYATPTVLIIDPSTEIQINRHNMHIWRDAYKISVEESVEYFTDIASSRKVLLAARQKSLANKSKKLANLNASIDQFELQQSKRLYQAYSILGPMLESTKEGAEPDEFRAYWKQVAKFRYQFTDDLAELRKKAIQLDSEKSEQNLLSFPQYASFDWEVEK